MWHLISVQWCYFCDNAAAPTAAAAAAAKGGGGGDDGTLWTFE